MELKALRRRTLPISPEKRWHIHKIGSELNHAVLLDTVLLSVFGINWTTLLSTVINQTMLITRPGKILRCSIIYGE